MNARQRNILILLLILLITVVSVILFATPRTQFKMVIAPASAYIKIDDGNTKRVKRGDTIKVSPGEHSITVSEDQFESYTLKLTAKENETVELLVALIPLTDEAAAKLSDTESQEIVQRFHGKAFTNETKQIDKEYPILDILPITARLYRVYPCKSQLYPNNPEKVAICVDGSEYGLEPYVEKDIKSRGYDPADYEMIYLTGTIGE